MVAILNHLDMFFKPGCEVASAGAVLDQANKCYKYFWQFCELPRFVQFCEDYQERTGRKFLQKMIQSNTRFATGSEQEILTGTEKGLRSPHPHKARIDEIDLMPWELLQTGMSMARSGIDRHQHIIRGQNVFTSTRQLVQGTMQRLLDEAADKGFEVYEWNIWETVGKCDRRCENDPKHGTCPIYVFCKGQAHHGTGWYQIDDFIDKVRVLDKITFETEWLNTRPAKHKLVFDVFDNSTHIMTPGRLGKMFGVNYPLPDWYRIAGLDFGASPGHPFVYLKLCFLPNGAWLVFFEYFREQALLRDHADVIKGSPYYLPGEFIYADWDRQDRMELRALGVRTRPAEKSVIVGLDFVKTLLSGTPFGDEINTQLYVWYECIELITQLGMYSWPMLPGGRIDRSGLPVKQHDDGPDALRYALFSHRRKTGRSYRGRKMTGI